MHGTRPFFGVGEQLLLERAGGRAIVHAVRLFDHNRAFATHIVDDLAVVCVKKESRSGCRYSPDILNPGVPGDPTLGGPGSHTHY